MRYRVKVRNSEDYPYKIQTYIGWKYFGFWSDVSGSDGIHASLDLAKDRIRHLVSVKNKVKHKVGDVVYQYDDSDLLVDKLKGN